MSKPEFGTKYTCEACAERFYDLNRSPVVCFKCHAVQAPPKPRMYRPLRASSDRGAFSRRPLPVAAEEKLETVDDLVVDDVEEADIPDDDDAEIDDDTDVEIEIEVDPDDGKALV
ncbi:MAG: TIGR02300 family protein [Acetobacteraceae bacterium]|nr:TIGR02300 family protein [Acetobacteraceae bacterium]